MRAERVPGPRFIFTALLIFALVGLGIYLALRVRGDGKRVTEQAHLPALEADDPRLGDINTVREYTYNPIDRLPAAEGSSGYRWDDKEKIVRFSYNIWPGWLPVIAANRGTRANHDSIFFKKYGFRLEMVLMEDPIAARKAFAAGEVHTLWGTVDMMVLMAPELVKDPRTAPRITQQIDWSRGGDGIVARGFIKSVADLRGRTIAVAQASAGEYYLVSALFSAGLGLSDVKLRHTATGFEASAVFVVDDSVDACVSWVPDMAHIPARAGGAHIISSTAEASKLISRVYAVRADFVRDHPEIVTGLVAGIFEGMDMVRREPEQPARWMADAFGIKPGEVMSMRNAAHLTNLAENIQFFMYSSNPTNFERAWKNASYLYQELGRLAAPVAFDQVVDFTFLRELRQKGMFGHHRDESVAAFTPSGFRKVAAKSPILAPVVRVSFYPNSIDPYEAARDERGKPIAGHLYDFNIDATLAQVARLSAQSEGSVIFIEGHADSSMKGKVAAHLVRELSLKRAEAVKRALVDKYKFDARRFSIEGKGWDVPVDASDPDNHGLNRRVEIYVYGGKK